MHRVLGAFVIKPLATCRRSVSTYASGSKALDVLLGGGYPSGSVIEILGGNLQSCWQLAWLAAGAVYARGWRVMACSGTACLDFGAERRLTDRDKLARTSVPQPEALLDLLRLMGQDCSLVLVDSWTRIAEAAAPGGPEPSASRSLRNRRLAAFLQHLSCRLLIPPKIEAGGRSGTSSGYSGGARQGRVPPPAPFVIFCNTEQGGSSLTLQRYATVRLRVCAEDSGGVESDEGGAAVAPSFLTVELLKGPATNTRLPISKTSLYLPGTRGLDGIPHHQNLAVVLDLLTAAMALGLVIHAPLRTRAGRRGGKQLSAELHGELGFAAEDMAVSCEIDTDVMGFHYGQTQAETLPALAAEMTASGLFSELQHAVDEKLQALIVHRDRSLG